MKSFRTYLTEVARQDHSTQPLHTIKSAGNRQMVFAGSEWVGHIDFHVGTPDLIPNSRDRYIAYIKTNYRDSRLKINRPVSRAVGEYSSTQAALDGIQAALANLRK